MTAGVRFFVPGVPQPGGSKKGFVVRTKTGKTRVAIVEDAKHNAPWRAKVALAAAEHFTAPLTGPLEAEFLFTMPRPKHHFGTGRRAEILKPNAPTGHTGTPDITKLIRSTEDALKGIAWVDDCQIVVQSASKLYGDVPGCWIMVRAYPEAREAATPGRPKPFSLFD